MNTFDNLLKINNDDRINIKKMKKWFYIGRYVFFGLKNQYFWWYLYMKNIKKLKKTIKIFSNLNKFEFWISKSKIYTIEMSVREVIKSKSRYLNHFRKNYFEIFIIEIRFQINKFKNQLWNNYICTFFYFFKTILYSFI